MTDSASAGRYCLELTALAGDELGGTLAAASGFRREFHSRLELLAAIEAALSEQPGGAGQPAAGSTP